MRPRRLRSLALLLVAATAGAAIPAPAAEPAAGELLAAVGRSPTLEAARKRIDAARARTESAGRLADPEVEAMSSRINADAMGENRNMWEISLRQPLPKRGERAADRERAQAVVSMNEADFAMAAGELAADVAMALAEAEGADARAKLIEAQLGRMTLAMQSMEARLTAGAAPRIADRLSLQTRIAALQLSLEQIRRMADDARATARGRLGLEPAAPLPSFAAPAVTDVSPGDSAVLAQAQARVAEANAMGKMARASAHPMTSVGVRFERERSSMGNQDTLGFAVSSEIPWRNRRYARADARAAEADRAAAQADAVAARHRIASLLTRVDRAERLAASARRVAGETQGRLDAEHLTLTQATSVSLGSGGGGMGGDSAVLHAVDILDKSTDTQMQIIEAETNARVTRAELWRYVPARRLLNPALNLPTANAN